MLFLRLPCFYIDEAQNLGRVSSGKKLIDQTDCIKSLANISQLQCVLIGTYELMNLRKNSGQLCRRSYDIHFSRYKAEDSEEFRQFRQIIRNFESQLPLQDSSGLVKHSTFLYERSLGCVGILKDWLNQSLLAILEQDEQAKKLTYKCLKEQAIPAQQCRIILNECLQQEKILADENSEEESELLRKLLGLEEHAPMSSPSSSGKRRKQRVGQPNPVRRPTSQNL